MARLGQRVIAVDSYDGAPAMQVTPYREVIDMLDGSALDAIVAKHSPDLIVPEIEAIRTERFYDYEAQGIQVVPSARAANFTMNRKAIRDLAAQELGLRTAPYRYAKTYAELEAAIAEIGLPCVVKPLMSSSGKGQSTVRKVEDISKAWEAAMAKGRGDAAEAIIEGFIDFDLEITLLTVTQKSGPTLFCPPIGHVQARGDYQESWQPCTISSDQLADAEEMARRVTESLGGAGLWGVEFFLAADGVVFSELSPRPHDTGMVTLSGSQNLSEFELHSRAVLGLPIPEVKLRRAGASAVVLADSEGSSTPTYAGIEAALENPAINAFVFGKPTTRLYRRMAVVTASGPIDGSMEEIRGQAKAAAAKISVTSPS